MFLVRSDLRVADSTKNVLWNGILINHQVAVLTDSAFTVEAEETLH